MISMSCIKELFAQKHLATVREICLCGSVPIQIENQRAQKQERLDEQHDVL